MPEDLLHKAFDWMYTKFKEKKRKGTGVPYFCHLAACLQCVAAYGGQEHARIGAILHDSVEDVGVTLEEIAAEFGPQMATLIDRLTEDKSLHWRDRKEKIFENARTRCQAFAIVLMADKIDNLRGHVRQWAPGVSGDYWSTFNAGFADQVWFHQQLLRALYANDRVRTASEYPELRTDDALCELLDVFDQFRAGQLWTPDGLVGAPVGRLWLTQNLWSEGAAS